MKKLFSIFIIVLVSFTYTISFADIDPVESNAYCEVIIKEFLPQLTIDDLKTLKDATDKEIVLRSETNDKDPEYLGIWQEKYFVDSFGDKTNQKYIVAYIQGTFSNMVTNNSPLLVGLMFYLENGQQGYKPRVRIQLYEYNDLPVKSSSNSIVYYFSIKDENNEIYYYTLNMASNSDKIKFDYDLKEYNTGEFERDARFIEFLKNNKVLKFSISDNDKYGKSTYRFNIDDMTGFENALNWLMSD